MELLHETGTYRATDGRLVHIRSDADGGTLIEVERAAPRRVAPADRITAGIVKLSDDPHWPDLEPPRRGTGLFD